MPTLGIDLSSNRFRIVELTKKSGFSVLVNYGIYEGPPLELNFLASESVDRYAFALKTFIKDHDFGTSLAVSALPENDVFIRVITTPVMSPRELKNFVYLSADEFIPISLKDVTYDAQIIETTEPKKKGDDKTMSVLLVASKNDVLNRYLDLLKRAGLTPVGLEPATLAIERVLGDTLDRPSASIIVNIGFGATQCVVTYKGFVRFTRSIPVGGDSLTKAVQKDLALEYAQAEEYKKTYGLEESQVQGKVYNAIKPVFDNILLEINRSKTYYTTQNPEVIINRVILTGGSAMLPGLLLYLANKLDVEVELANPWRNIKISEDISHSRDALISDGPLYSTAVGLALKDY